jgi:hypothetical protein
VALADIRTLSPQDKIMILPFRFNAQKISDEVFFGVTLYNSKAHHRRLVWWLACWPLVPEFAGSIPTEAVGFFPM